MNCVACNLPYQTQSRCTSCCQVLEIVLDAEPGSLLLVVDGSVNSTERKNIKQAGAGLVLADAETEAVIAYCTPSFQAHNACEAEYQAIVRGLRWAPVEVAWSDCKEAIEMALSSSHPASWISFELREPLHNFAHKLANAIRLLDYERLRRIWVPGEVWPEFGLQQAQK